MSTETAPFPDLDIPLPEPFLNERMPQMTTVEAMQIMTWVYHQTFNQGQLGAWLGASQLAKLSGLDQTLVLKALKENERVGTVAQLKLKNTDGDLRTLMIVPYGQGEHILQEHAAGRLTDAGLIREALQQRPELEQLLGRLK